ncbi:hypothetical protein GOBAR_DD18770 [Gossypium barbadense]|nr:hypothetical protein GOBAR_DD18770 [Gossypium barbadense]
MGIPCSSIPVPNSYGIDSCYDFCTLGKQREDVYERDIQQQEEGKGLNRGTPEHLAISDVLISMVTHYFDESFLRTEENYVNTYSKSHLSDSIVEDTIFLKNSP